MPPQDASSVEGRGGHQLELIVVIISENKKGKKTSRRIHSVSWSGKNGDPTPTKDVERTDAGSLADANRRPKATAVCESTKRRPSSSIATVYPSTHKREIRKWQDLVTEIEELLHDCESDPQAFDRFDGSNVTSLLKKADEKLKCEVLLAMVFVKQEDDVQCKMVELGTEGARAKDELFTQCVRLKDMIELRSSTISLCGIENE